MKKYLFIVLLVGVCFGQDTYPYFSDMSKQLEFEKNRIIIEEVERTQQIITGGESKFNPWSLLVLPTKLPYNALGGAMLKNAPIETDYKYISYFNIKISTRNISEIEMLRTLGLEQEANKIINKFETVVEQYNSLKPDTTIDIKYYQKKKWAFWLLLASPFAIRSGKNDDSPEVVIAGYLAIANYVINWFDRGSNYYVIQKKIPKPILKQQLNITQTKSLVESYNRKLYSDISKK